MADYDWIKRGERRQRVLKEAMNKPRTPSEIRTKLGLSSGNKLEVTMQELVERGLARKKARGLYGLTEEGRELRTALLSEAGQPIVYVEPKLDWLAYLWVMQGAQRRAFVKVLRQYPIMAAKLLRMARDDHKTITRTNAYDVLKALTAKSIAQMFRDHPYTLYALTRKGEQIKRQMLAAWVTLFVFL